MQILAPTNSQKQPMKCTGQNRHPDPRQRPRTETCPPDTTTTKSTQTPRPPWHEETAGKWIQTKIRQYHITHGKSPPSPTARRKKFSMPFPSNPAPKQILNFPFMIPFVKLMASNFRQWMIQVSKSIYFPRDSLRPTCFDAIIRQRLKKKLKLLWTFFLSREWSKTLIFNFNW